LKEKHREWLQKDLTSKSTELLELKKTHSNQLLAAKSQLSEATSKSQSYEQQLKTANQEISDLVNQMASSFVSIPDGYACVIQTRQMADLRAQLKDGSTDFVSADERFQKELTAQKKLVQLHKEAFEEQERKTRDAATVIDELREKVNKTDLSMTSQCRTDWRMALLPRDCFIPSIQASSIDRQHNAQLQELSERFQQELKDAQQMAEQKITELQQQVSSAGANKALESSSASAARLMESGLSVTEMYDRAFAAEERAGNLQTEKQRLEAYLQQILREIEEKAPDIAGQRLDDERALASHDELSQRLDQATREINQAECDKDEVLRENTKLARDNDAMKVEVGDLARQVQGLLRGQLSAQGGGQQQQQQQQKQQPPQLSGFAPAMATPAKSPFAKAGNHHRGTPGSAVAAHARGGDTVTAQAVISENLVTFADIPQLQARNQQLLKVVRRLSEAKEDQLESRVNDTENALALEAALKELENMRSARLRQEEMVTAIIKQRDMYRSLLQQANSEFSKQTAATPGGALAGGSPQKLFANAAGSPMAASASSTAMVVAGEATVAAAAATEQAEQALAQKAKMVSELETQLQRFTAERTETERILKSDLEKTRSVLNAERVKGARAQVDATFHIVRYVKVEALIESNRQELERQRGEYNALQVSEPPPPL
jgi:nucleoprotein TPR